MRRNRRNFQKVGQNDNEEIIISNSGGGIARTNGLIIFTLVIIALSATVFTIVLTKRLDDQDARDIVRAEQPLLEEALVNIHEALIIEQGILEQKTIANNLLTEYSTIKMWISQNTPKIQAIDDLTDLATMINGTILNITIGFNNQITNLENTLQDLLSVSSQTTGTIIKSGTCTMQGTTSTSVNYSYKKLIISGLDYFYYVFESTGMTTNVTSFGRSLIFLPAMKKLTKKIS